MQNQNPLAAGHLSSLRNLWENEYEDTRTPFDIEEPDEWIASLARSGKIQGNVLDAGCGPGRNSIYLAELGCSVVGVDISSKAIERARRKAAGKGKNVQFLQANIYQLAGYDRHFDTVVDIGCFHSLDECYRGVYAAALHRACREGAAVYLRAFRWNHPCGQAAPTLTGEEIRTAFSTHGWVVKDLVEREIELFISETEKPRTPCWFATLRYSSPASEGSNPCSECAAS